MKLYYAPGACSLASRISFHEAGQIVDFERVDIHFKVTERGQDFLEINPKGYVPMLVLDSGEAVTENIAILGLIAEHYPQLQVEGPLARTRLLEMLSFLSSEVHVAFKPLWHGEDELEKAGARQTVALRLSLIEDDLRELYLFGPRFTVADAYLFVMLRWALDFGVPVSAELVAYFERVAERPAVRRALAEEGLAMPHPRIDEVVTIAEVSIA
jgi:glutathione S-transferase